MLVTQLQERIEALSGTFFDLIKLPFVLSRPASAFSSTPAFFFCLLHLCHHKQPIPLVC